jgi:hypothetical protein
MDSESSELSKDMESSSSKGDVTREASESRDGNGMESMEWNGLVGVRHEVSKGVEDGRFRRRPPKGRKRFGHDGP